MLFVDKGRAGRENTTVLKGRMTGGRETRWVIGQTEVNYVCAGREETVTSD